MINDIIINIDLLQAPSSNSLFVMQREKDSKRLVFNITSNGKSVELEGKTVIFCMQKPDGEVIFNNCTIDEEVSTILTSQSQATNGICACWLKVVDGETITYSPKFNLKILGVADFSGAVESSSEFTALESALVAAQKIENLSTNATTLTSGYDATAELVDAGETIVLELGIPQGIQGATGNTGASAYDVWLSLGNNGTEQDFIDSLRTVSGSLPTLVFGAVDVLTSTLNSVDTGQIRWFTTGQNTTNLPTTTTEWKFAMGYICRPVSSRAKIVLFSSITNGVAYNTYAVGEWVGWRIV